MENRRRDGSRTTFGAESWNFLPRVLSSQPPAASTFFTHSDWLPYVSAMMKPSGARTGLAKTRTSSATAYRALVFPILIDIHCPRRLV